MHPDPFAAAVAARIVAILDADGANPDRLDDATVEAALIRACDEQAAETAAEMRWLCSMVPAIEQAGGVV